MRITPRHLLPALLGGALALTVSLAASATNFLQVYRQARAHDPVFQEAYATYMAAREARPEAWAVLLPQLSATAGKTWTHTSGSSGAIGVNSASSGTSTQNVFTYSQLSSSDSTAKQWSLNLSEKLFSWTDWMNLKAANSQVAEAQATYEAAGQKLILRTATAYFNVLAAVDVLKAQESSLQALTLGLQQAKESFKVGLIAITGVEQARAARDSAAALVISDKQLLANALDQLEVITGSQYRTLAEPGKSLPLASPQPASQSAWVHTSLRQNLTLIAARLAHQVARDNVRAAFGNNLPTVSLVASRSYSSNDISESVFGQLFHGLGATTNDRQIGIELTVPIFSGGGDLALLHQTQYQAMAAQDAVEQASRSTIQQARDAYLGVITGIANVRALRQALTSSRTAYRATEAGYKVGTQTEVDVLTAISTLVSAETRYATSRYNYITSLIQLRYAAGTLTPAQVTTINAWLTKPVSVAPEEELTPENMTPPAAPEK